MQHKSIYIDYYKFYVISEKAFNPGVHKFAISINNLNKS